MYCVEQVAYCALAEGKRARRPLPLGLDVRRCNVARLLAAEVQHRDWCRGLSCPGSRWSPPSPLFASIAALIGWLAALSTVSCTVESPRAVTKGRKKSTSHSTSPQMTFSPLDAFSTTTASGLMMWLLPLREPTPRRESVSVVTMTVQNDRPLMCVAQLCQSGGCCLPRLAGIDGQ